MKLIALTSSAHITSVNLDAACYINTGKTSRNTNYIEIGVHGELPELDADELLVGIKAFTTYVTVYDNAACYGKVYAYITAQSITC